MGTFHLFVYTAHSQIESSRAGRRGGEIGIEASLFQRAGQQRRVQGHFAESCAKGKLRQCFFPRVSRFQSTSSIYAVQHFVANCIYHQFGR
jgi:hypothetical protein